MWKHPGWFVLLVLFECKVRVISEDDDLIVCCRNGQLNEHSDWYSKSNESASYANEHFPVCKDNITTIDKSVWPKTLLINFQPKNEFGVFGVSLCKDETLENCHVVEIFGLVSGRIGYFWRQHSRNESGEELWVPGKKEKLPSTLLKSYTVVRKGTWDRNGKTLYQFYVEARRSDDRIRIRYNGGSAKQQKEMVFPVPYDTSTMIMTVASYYNDSYVSVVGSTGCSTLQEKQFEPGQDLVFFLTRPAGAVGISLCTDPGRYECYVLEMSGFNDTQLSYFWRKYSLFEESGEEGWVPGLKTKLNGTLLKRGKHKPKFVDESPWEGPSAGMFIKIVRTFNDKLIVFADAFTLPNISLPYLTFDIPDGFEFTTVDSREVVAGKEVIRSDIDLQGPCFNGLQLGYITETCKKRIPARDPAWPEGKAFDVFSPRPGLAEAEVLSKVLESKTLRKRLCVSLHGMVGQRGSSLIVKAVDATGKSNKTVEVGQLTYNNVHPPEWQRVRLSVDLPPSLQNTELRVTLTSRRTTPDSFVLLHESRLCSYDGCGLPTPKGTPFIAFGEETYPAKYPWHVAIFRIHNKTKFEYICGGSLIRSDAVISAAHCFFNAQGKLEDKTKFKLTVGKKYNSLHVYEPNQQFSYALDIKIPSRYTGEMSHYIQDIAIIRVNFSIESLVLPVCVDWFDDSFRSLQKGDVGQVAGWGLHEGNVERRELFFANLPYIPYDQCINAIPQTFVGFVTPDKFCAGNINGSTVRRGDSGGGLVFERGGLWYLRGVVSTGVPDLLTYTTFTDVAYFMTWIRKVLNITKTDY